MHSLELSTRYQRSTRVLMTTYSLNVGDDEWGHEIRRATPDLDMGQPSP
jgi:hypothetical protein